MTNTLKNLTFVVILSVLCVYAPVASAYTITNSYDQKQCATGSQVGSIGTSDSESGLDCVAYCAGLGSTATCCSANIRYAYDTDLGGYAFTSTKCTAYNTASVSTVPNTSTNFYEAYTISYAESSDLTVGSVTPTTATAGSAVTLTATISNSGTASTDASFTNLFQRATDSSGTSSTDIGTYDATTLAASGSASATLSYTFPSAATWYVRACADKSSSASTGTITESDEANNCGAWTAVTVSAALPAETLPELSASTPYVSSGTQHTGDTTTFSATTTNSGTADTSAYYSNRFQVDLSADGSYDITLDAASSTNGLAIGESKLVTSPSWTAVAGTHTVRLCTDIPPITVGSVAESNEDNNCGAAYTFTTSNYSAGSYTTTTSMECVDGTVLGTTHIYADYPQYYAQEGETCRTFCSSLGAACCTEDHYVFNDSANPEPVGFQWFNCTAQTGTSMASKASTFRYTPPPGSGHYREYIESWSASLITYGSEVAAYLVGNPQSITSGHTSLLTWSSTGSNSCTGTGFSTGNATSGSVLVTPAVTTTYSVSCTNGSQTAVSTTTVSVSDILGVSCTATPNPATVFSSVLWTSAVSGGAGAYEYSWSGTDSLSGIESSITKSYSSVGNKSATLTVISGSETVSTECNDVICQSASCTCSGPTCGLEVAEGTSTDLSANTPVLLTGLNEEGNTVTFQGTITNIGDTTVSGSFQNRFQVDIDGDGSYDLNLDASAASYTIGLSDSATVASPEWSAIPTGTHKVRFCSDLPPAGTGSIAEVNEDNNCSGTLTFAVGPSLLSLSIVSSVQRVKTGGTAVITWSAENADSCTVSGPGLSSTATSGQQTVTVTGEGRYVITCARGTGTQTASVTVKVAPKYEEI